MDKFILGKAKIKTRKWASIKSQWQDADHDDTTIPFLLKTQPQDHPTRLIPDLSGLKLGQVKNDLRRGVVKGFIKEEELEEWTAFMDTLENESNNGDDTYGNFPLYDIMPDMTDSGKEPTPSTDSNSESTSESDHIALVHLGRRQREVPQIPPKKDCMIAVYNKEYVFSWPQIGKVIDIVDNSILLHWFSGGDGHPCLPLKQPKQQRRLPWVEEIPMENVITGPFKLTKKKLLPKKIEKMLSRKFKDYFE